MSNFLKKGKKAISIGVTVTTIVWTLGVAGLAPAAQAQTLSAGDLLQCDLKDAKCPKDRALYWFTADGKRLTFPNEKSYKTWYEDFKSVTIKQLSFDELAAIPLAGNVTYRSGTRLGKITTDPKTYAVEPGGVLRHLPSEAAAKMLYGDNWAKWVDDIPDVFFGNYTVGAALKEGEWPNGMVLKAADAETLYLVDGGKKRMIADFNAFKANGYNSAYIVSTAKATLDKLAAGDSVTGAETKLQRPWTAAAAAGAAAEKTGTALTVEQGTGVSSSTHASGSAFNNAMHLKMTAGSDGDVKVTSLKVTRSGISSDTSISGIALYDEAGMRYGNVVTFADNKTLLSFDSAPLTVAAGSTKMLYLKTNTAGTSGTYWLSVNAAGDVGTKATVSGTFPMNGPVHSLADGSSSVGNLTVDVVNLSTAAVATDIGDTKEITKLRLSQANGNEHVWLKKLMLFNNGTSADEDVQNFELVPNKTLKDPADSSKTVYESGKTIATVEKASGRYLTFDLSAKPLPIAKGTFVDLSVKGKALSGSNRTMQLIVQNDYDVLVTGSGGSGILATANAASTTDTSFPIGDIAAGASGFNQISISQGTLTVNRSSNSPSGNIGRGAQDQVLAIWDLEAKGEAVQIQRMDFDITGTGITNADFTGTLKLMTEAGQTLYSVAASTANVYDGDAGGTDQVTLASYYTINPGESNKLKLKLVVDTATGLGTSDAPQGRISDIYFKRLVSNTFGTSSAATFVPGHARTGTAATLTVNNNGSFASKTVVEGQNEMLLGSYYLTTGSTEGVNISSVALGLTVNDAPVTVLSNLKLMKANQNDPYAFKAENQIGSTLSTGAATNTFTVSGQLNIPASTTMRIDLYGNMSTGGDDGDQTLDTYQTTLAIDAVSGTGAGSGTAANGPAAALSGATLTATPSGTLTVAVETSGAASSQFVTTGVTGFEMARLKLSATTEEMKVDELTLRTVNGTGSLATVTLKGTGLTADPSVPLTGGLASFSFPSGSEIKVPADGSRVLTVEVSTSGLHALVGGKHGTLGFGTLNAKGSATGAVVQERLTGTVEVAGTNTFAGAVGDVVYFTSTAAAGTNANPGYYVVTTINNTTLTTAGALALNGGAVGTSWTAGDVLTTLTEVFTDATLASLSTAVSVGDLVFFHDTSTPANDGFYTVGTAAAATDDLTTAVNELGLSGGPVNLVAVTYATGDSVTKVSNANGLVGNTMRFEEVEPTITKKTFAQGSNTPDAVVGMFEVKAEGSRDMTFNSLTLQKNTGLNEPYRYVSTFSLWNGTTKLSEVATTTLAGTADTALTTAVIGGTTGLEFCTTDDGGAAVADEVSGISAAEYAKLAVGDKVTFSDGTDEITATVAFKGALVATCSGAVNTGDNITFSSISQTKGSAAVGTAVNLYNHMVHFDASQSDTGDTALSSQSITAGGTMTLTVKADLSSVFGPVTTGTVSFNVTIPGSAGPLRVTAGAATTAATPTPGDVEGLSWGYTSLGVTANNANGGTTAAGAVANRTEGDSYPVTSQNLTY